MPTVLTPAQQENHFGLLKEVTLDNFSMAWRLVEVLIQYRAGNLPPPQATLLLRGDGPPVTISGTNCGFFVNPVVNTAVMDCRRSLEFFGLGCDHRAKRLHCHPTGS